MLGHFAVIALQLIGIAIPIIAIIILLKTGQGKNNALLVMANFGALIMNWGYFRLLEAKNYAEAMSIYQFEYAGSILFYLFFLLFVKSFLVKNKKSLLFYLAVSIFICIEGATLFAISYHQSWVYENIDMSYFEDAGKLYQDASDVIKEDTVPPPDKPEEGQLPDDSADDKQPPAEPEGDAQPPSPQPPKGQGTLFELGEDASIDDVSGNGYIYLNITHGPLLMVRYCYLAFLLFIGLVSSCIYLWRNKVAEERRKMAFLVGAQFVIFGSLLFGILYNGSYDFIPMLVSASVLVIICGTASGNFYTVADRGRGWVLEQTDNIFIILDSKCRFLNANDYAKKMFPVLASIPVYSEIPQEIKDTFMCDNLEFEFEGKHFTKKMAPIEIRRGKKEIVVGYSIMLVDVSNLYSLMHQLEDEKQKAIDANNAKSNFMSNMSHEIRTPMNAIVGMTEIMLRHEQDDFNTEYLNNIKNSGAALLTVINDILDFSKIESGKLEIIPDEYEIMSVLNDLGMIFLNRIGEKPIELIYDIDPQMPNRLFGDSGRIRQVLLNIVNNGIKYTDSGYVKLAISLRKDGDDSVYLDCAVEDTGIGIKEEDLTKIFSTFSQVDTKRNRGKEGSGLGLSIAKQLIETMGGQISVESEYGKGSTFRFSMKQGIVSPSSPAAVIKGKETVSVTGIFSHPENLSMLEKLCSYYDNVRYIDAREVFDTGVDPDFVFLDRESDCFKEHGDKVRDFLRSSSSEIISLTNPMAESCDSGDVTIMNKPLYTLNFCLALNHEVLSFKETQEQLYTFTAPAASVLIVDDNEINRKVAIGLMEPFEMQADMANDGKQAVEKISENHYDIVFMDHMMPIMDGVEATEAIRKMEGDYYKTLPIIALSANALAEAREQFRSVGMSDFLAKPIKTKELTRLLLKYLPADKVINSGQKPAEVQAQSEEFPVIEGLDVAAGVENSGGLKLFTSLLGDFYKLIDRKSVKIEKCLNDGMIRDYTIEVHALKNTARMIGALELSDMFYRLEMAGNENDIETIERETPAALSLYQSYKPILEPYAAVSNEKKTELSREEIIAALRELRDAMDGFDLDGADVAMKKLEEARMPEEIRRMVDELGACVADVAMEDVMNLCNQIIAKCS